MPRRRAGRSVAALALLAGCVQRAPEAPDAAVGVFCEAKLGIAEQPHRFVDLLFVLGDDRFAAEVPRLVGLLDMPYPAMHVAVISSDAGAFDGGDWFSYRERTDATEDKDFEGTMTDALAGLSPAGGASQILAAIVGALDGSRAEAAGFRRDEVLLAVVVLTDHDDASPGAATAYARALASAAATSRDLQVSVLAPEPSPRLDEMLAALAPSRGYRVPAGLADPAVAMYPAAAAMALLPWETAVPEDLVFDDLDPGRPGRQLGCATSDLSAQGETILARCVQLDDARLDPATPTPCWWFRPTDPSWQVSVPYWPFVERSAPTSPWNNGNAQMRCLACAP